MSGPTLDFNIPGYVGPRGADYEDELRMLLETLKRSKTAQNELRGCGLTRPVDVLFIAA